MPASELTIADLQALLEPHMQLTAWPRLNDERVRNNAIRYAKRYGTWRSLTKNFDPEAPIPVLRHSDYREFERTGNRQRFEPQMRALLARTDRAAMALWLGHPKASVDTVNDLLWAWTETTFWVPAAHATSSVDLFSSDVARRLAEIMALHAAVLDPRVKARVTAEIERRVLHPAQDWRTANGWLVSRNNWNHVCCANVIISALYLISDPRKLAVYILPFLHAMQAGLDGFGDDGGCTEGPGYWQYGFGHYVDTAVAMHHRTGGALNIMTGAKIENIARYPLACVIDGPIRTTFADSSHGYFPARIMLAINQFFDRPELYGMCRKHPDGRLILGGWADFCICDGKRVRNTSDNSDYVLPDLGQVKLRAANQPGTVLAAIAGRNDVHHNHNDIGSFIYYARGISFLTDPGAPVYKAHTFTSRRYEILHCRSRGHSVPVINGREQAAGRYTDDPKDAYGSLSVEGMHATGVKVCKLDLTHAYDIPALRSLIRTFRLAPNGSLQIEDAYALTDTPTTIEEAFITLEPARLLNNGQAVRIGKGRTAAKLTAVETPGIFAIQALTEESKEGHSGLVRRITFTPRNRHPRMTLTFEIG